jgi:hypothetical protein
MPATPRTITTSGVGHHQCSQKAPGPWLPSNPAPKTPTSTNPAPSTRPTRFTLRAYRSLALATVRYKRYSVVTGPTPGSVSSSSALPYRGGRALRPAHPPQHGIVERIRGCLVDKGGAASLRESDRRRGRPPAKRQESGSILRVAHQEASFGLDITTPCRWSAYPPDRAEESTAVGPPACLQVRQISHPAPIPHELAARRRRLPAIPATHGRNARSRG